MPEDEHNQALVANVHPSAWRNPEPAGALQPRRHRRRDGRARDGGGGRGARRARVALVERHLMGGDCLNVGCVPSKGLVRASRAWAEMAGGNEFGLAFPGAVQRDFGAVMDRMRRLRARLSRVDSAERFTGLGVDVFIGDGRFTGPDTVEVDGAVLRFARAAICTGARAAALPIPGLADAGYLTNETIFSLTELPDRLAVIGAGPIGCEMAQAFARFGSQVTLIEQTPRILPREDPDAAAIVQARMRADGVRLAFDAAISRVEERADGTKLLRFAAGGAEHEVEADEILVGRGPGAERRRPGSGAGRRRVRPDRREGEPPPADGEPAGLRRG